MTRKKASRLAGGEMLTVTATLTSDQWALLFGLIHQGAPMYPASCWDLTDHIAKTLEEAVDTAVKGD